MAKFERPPGWVKGRELTDGERDEARHMLQALFEGARLVRNAIEPQTGVLGLSVGQWRSQWDALRRDLDSFTERVSVGHGPQARIFRWRWKAQPPLEDIAAEADRLASMGRRVFQRRFEDGSDSFAWIVSDHQVSDAEAERIDDADSISVDELGQEERPPYHVDLGFTDDQVARGEDFGRYDFPNLGSPGPDHDNIREW